MGISPVVKTGETARDRQILEGFKKVGLGDIAKAGVASGLMNAVGYVELPVLVGGAKKPLIIQWGWLSGSPANGTSLTLSGAYPVTFPNALFQIIPVLRDISGAGNISAGVSVYANYYDDAVSRSTAKVGVAGSNLGTAISIRYIAVGY